MITSLIPSAPEEAQQIAEISPAPARVIEEDSVETPPAPLPNEGLRGQDDAFTDEEDNSQLATIDLEDGSGPEAPAGSPPIPSLPPPTSEEVPPDAFFEDDDVGLVDLNIENEPENDLVGDDKNDFVNPSSDDRTDDDRLSTTETFPIPPPPPPPPEPKEEFFRVVEEMPRFPAPECENLGTMQEKKICADKKMLEFIYDNVKYPAIARENGVEGTVVIQVVVEKDGTLNYAKILRDIGAQCGEEALRVVNLMNERGLKWVPGKQRGEPTRVEFNIPVKFRLD